MLVHHPDPVIDRVARGVDSDALAVQADLTLVRVVEAVEDVHEGRLAGAVLTEQRVNLSLAQVEIDVVVRHDPGKALRDSQKLE